MERPIDAAMAASRPAKDTVRQRWIDECRSWQGKSDHLPLYVTLPGSDGLDIALLIEHGILTVLENNAIADEAAGLVVAVERNLPAAGALRARYPGLKVVPNDIAHELRVSRLVTDLSREAKQFGRGLIINLDFNGPFSVSMDTHPVLDLIDRLADVHRESPVRDWTLLLTHNTDTSGWPESIVTRHARMLVETMKAHSDLDAWWKVFGRDVEPVLAGELFSSWSRQHQQCLLQILVPLLVLSRVCGAGWDVRVGWSAVYGGAQTEAPMVTWVIHFDFDRDKCAAPLEQRSHCIKRLISAVGRIDDSTGTWKQLV